MHRNESIIYTVYSRLAIAAIIYIHVLRIIQQIQNGAGNMTISRGRNIFVCASTNYVDVTRRQFSDEYSFME